MKNIVKAIRRAARKAHKSLTQQYAPYEVRCTYGTRQKTWTLREAMSWLPLCEGLTVVVHRSTGKLIASRDPQAEAAF